MLAVFGGDGARVLDDVRPMSQARESFVRLAEGTVFGKLVLTT